MNKSVLRTMIILCWVFLALYTVLKLVPQLASKFVIVVNNEKIVKAGQFIDERKWLGDIIYFLTTLLTYQFYLCACCHKWFLSIKQYLVSLAIIVPTFIVNVFIPQVALTLNFVAMIVLPYLLKADFRTFVIIFTTHTMGQLALGYIRSENLMCVDVNFLSQAIMLMDMYVWLLLYYLYANLYKGEKFMGKASPPLFKKYDREINEEIAKLDEKITTCDDEKKRKRYEADKAELESMRETSDEK